MTKRQSHEAARAEFEDRVLKAVAAYGDAFERAPIIAEFLDRGVPRSTVFGWMKDVIERRAPRSKKGASTATPAQRKEQEQREQRGAPPPPVVAGVAHKLPPIPSVEDVQSKGLLPVVQLLLESIKAAQDLMAFARDPRGAVRNARLLVQGSEHLRRAVETAAKLNDSVAIHQEMQRFHAVVLEEIGRLDPEAQQAILSRLRSACDVVLADG